MNSLFIINEKDPLFKIKNTQISIYSLFYISYKKHIFLKGIPFKRWYMGFFDKCKSFLKRRYFLLIRRTFEVFQKRGFRSHYFFETSCNFRISYEFWIHIIVALPSSIILWIFQFLTSGYFVHSIMASFFPDTAHFKAYFFIYLKKKS